MSDFKPGDKVLIRATVEGPLDGDGEYYLLTEVGRTCCWARPAEMEPAPEPPYVDPELVPGMIVVPLYKGDDRRWWVTRDDTSPHYGDRPFTFFTPDGIALERGDLPPFRVVFDPRKVTS